MEESHVNNQLKAKYKILFKQLDGLFYLKAKNFNYIEKLEIKAREKTLDTNKE